MHIPNTMATTATSATAPATGRATLQPRRPPRAIPARSGAARPRQDTSPPSTYCTTPNVMPTPAAPKPTVPVHVRLTEVNRAYTEPVKRPMNAPRLMPM